MGIKAELGLGETVHLGVVGLQSDRSKNGHLSADSATQP